MHLLGLDIGSSSVKAGIVRNGKILHGPARADFVSRFEGVRAEVDPAAILKAIRQAINDLSSAAKKADVLGLTGMSPAWVAMDQRGKALTPIITHQDRRSVHVAEKLEKRVGKAKHLRIAGNRPFPGGISSTTAAWFVENHPEIIRRADLLGHLNTFLHRRLTGRRVIDPSNASFTGLYETVKQGGWSDELIHAVGVKRNQLPEILESNVIAGHASTAAARELGLPDGIPVLAGIIDTSSAMFEAGAAIGQLLNVGGSTDVLGLCTSRPHPHEKLLTRALGVGRKWMTVGTLAASGSAIRWCWEQLFCDMPEEKFYRLVDHLAGKNADPAGVVFDPYLAGERTSIEQKRAAFHGLTLGTTRLEMLAAVVDALARASAVRVELLKSLSAKIDRNVMTSGGSARRLNRILHRDWPGHWQFHFRDEATLRGLSRLTPH
ncbi:MAG: FGGY family carbohydrate kinase [Tepidisphaeraceae bacterium]|jgi:xylulokinase